MRNVNDGKKQLIFLMALLAALIMPVLASAAEPLGKRILFENGMVLLLTEKHDIPVVAVNVSIKAGSREVPGSAANVE